MVSWLGVREVLGCCEYQEGEEKDEEQRDEPVHGVSDRGEVRSTGHISSLETCLGDELLK